MSCFVLFNIYFVEDWSFVSWYKARGKLGAVCFLQRECSVIDLSRVWWQAMISCRPLFSVTLVLVFLEPPHFALLEWRYFFCCLGNVKGVFLRVNHHFFISMCTVTESWTTDYSTLFSYCDLLLLKLSYLQAYLYLKYFKTAQSQSDLSIEPSVIRVFWKCFAFVVAL